MNIQAEKIELVRLVLDTDDVNIIRKIKEYLKNPTKSPETSGDFVGRKKGKG